MGLASLANYVVSLAHPMAAAGKISKVFPTLSVGLASLANYVVSLAHPLCRRRRPNKLKKRFSKCSNEFDIFLSVFLFAERVGFKPTVRETRTPDFESGPFDHSGIFP